MEIIFSQRDTDSEFGGKKIALYINVLHIS